MVFKQFSITKTELVHVKNEILYPPPVLNVRQIIGLYFLLFVYFVNTAFQCFQFFLFSIEFSGFKNTIGIQHPAIFPFKILWQLVFELELCLKFELIIIFNLVIICCGPVLRSIILVWDLVTLFAVCGFVAVLKLDRNRNRNRNRKPQTKPQRNRKVLFAVFALRF